MIRLRIEKEVKTFSKEGLIWYKAGRPYQVVLEQESPPKVSPLGYQSEEWIPVEVIDEIYS